MIGAVGLSRTDLLLEVPDLVEEVAADLRGFRVVAVGGVRALACARNGEQRRLLA